MLGGCHNGDKQLAIGSHGAREGILTKRYKLLSSYFPRGMNTCLNPISEILVRIDEEMGSGGQVVWIGRHIKHWNT